MPLYEGWSGRAAQLIRTDCVRLIFPLRHRSQRYAFHFLDTLFQALPTAEVIWRCSPLQFPHAGKQRSVLNWMLVLEEQRIRCPFRQCHAGNNLLHINFRGLQPWISRSWSLHGRLATGRTRFCLLAPQGLHGTASPGHRTGRNLDPCRLSKCECNCFGL